MLLSLGRRAAWPSHQVHLRASARSFSVSQCVSRQADAPFRLAVVGSGPAGFYTAYRVMSKLPQARVDMYEALPVPFGLVRHGVAPDHPEVKNCQEKFDEVATSPNFTFIGNVSIGLPGHQSEHCTIPLKVLTSQYDSILFSYGASEDKKLHIPGESCLGGIYSARQFVGWYNGHPDCTELAPDLSRSEEAVIIGQGNVALDVARILLEDVDVLRKTDISESALAQLAQSRVKRVHVVGRRGPMQAFVGSKLEPSHVGGTEFYVTKLEDAFNPRSSVALTEETITLPSDIAFRSVGYKSVALPGFAEAGIHFDEKRGVIKNDGLGRAIQLPADASNSVQVQPSALPGVYCAGWVKNGPTGVIASTMRDAFITGDAVVQDWLSGAPFLGSSANGMAGGWAAVSADIGALSNQVVTWDQWRQIDRVERERGLEKGKERDKFTNVGDMLNSIT
ncbi:hypothetical protein ACHAPE_005765 [Trichoderma viride]